MYEEMYHKLAGAVAEAMDLIEAQEYQRALELLERASQEAEKIYIGE